MYLLLFNACVPTVDQELNFTPANTAANVGQL